MKTKNSFSKLRNEKRLALKELEMANKIISEQKNDIKHLSDNLELQQTEVYKYKKLAYVEEKQKNRFKLRYIESKRLKDEIYSNYIKDLDKLNNKIFRHRALVIIFILIYLGGLLWWLKKMNII